MVLLSPHAVPVVSSMWIRVGVTLTRFRFLEDGPGRRGSALSLDVQEVQHLSQPGHRKTPEARTTATVAATEITAAQHLLWKTIPTFYLILARSFALALALSDSVTL